MIDTITVEGKFRSDKDKENFAEEIKVIVAKWKASGVMTETNISVGKRGVKPRVE